MSVTTMPIPGRVRTLAASAAAIRLSIAGEPGGSCPTRGAVDAAGSAILLIKPGEALHAAGDEVGVSVDLLAVRELDEGDHVRGRLQMIGWAGRLPRERARTAAVSIAAHCPDEDLFTALERFGDPGAPRLVRVEPAEVSYQLGPESGILDCEDYLAAAPDPLREPAEQILAHVNGSHRDDLAEGLRDRLGSSATGSALWELDGYGATVRLRDGDLIRFAWSRPVRTAHDMENALRSLVCGCDSQ